MAVPKKKRLEAAKLADEINEAIQANIGELWSEHAVEILNVIEESENGKLAVGFSTSLDFSESEPKVTTTIRFATTVTDKRVKALENPDQLRLFTPKGGASEEPAENDEDEEKDEPQTGASRTRTVGGDNGQPEKRKRGRPRKDKSAAGEHATAE